MIAYLKQLLQTRDLIRAWTGRIVSARYQQSVMGSLWIIIQPAASVVIFTIIFTYVVPVDTGDTPYIVFSYVALVPWMFLANSIMDMANSITDNLSLVTKVYFPREILPISALLARLFDFLVAAALLVVLIIVYRLPLHPVAWLALPLVLATQTLLAIGIGLALAAVNVFYRDVRPLLTLGIQLWFYASPILYPVTLVPEQIRPYYFLNPMAAILEAYRDILLAGRMPGIYLGPTIIMAILIFASGYWGFKQLETQFADII